MAGMWKGTQFAHWTSSSYELILWQSVGLYNKDKKLQIFVIGQNPQGNNLKPMTAEKIT